MKENTSVVDEGTGTTRLVTKSDGSKVPYSEEHLRNCLETQMEGLNREYLNLEIILHKVNAGLYNGKCKLTPTSLLVRPSPSWPSL